MGTTFRAAKSQSQGREGWCALFRHPLRRDGDGRPKRVRRGLGTRDGGEADMLVEQLNHLLQDESYWTLAAKDRAFQDFDNRIVSIFYDEIEARAEDPWESRASAILLPGRDDGYTLVQLVGSTGAGKTTLIRQLIGSDPKHDKFPSTSTAKTTVFDTEIVLRPGPYEAVVSFLTCDQIRSYIEECTVAAVSASVEANKLSVVVRRLLEHAEQRFRLSYLLGTLPESETDEVDEFWEEEFEDNRTDGESEIDEEERKELEVRLRSFLDRIGKLGTSVKERLAGELGVNLRSLKPGDHDALKELLEDELHEDEEAQSLVYDIFDEVKSRFDLLSDGIYEKDRSGWPIRWCFKTSERQHFIRTINRFTSNYAPNFGRLLGPLVQGVRVAGPFRPGWIQGADIPKLVLMDGEGLGHTADSASSVPTAVMKRYFPADVILLVDNAVQPMQAGAQAVIRSVITSGYESKLSVVFTHFEQVKGDNLPNARTRRDHVLASLDNVMNGLTTILDAAVVRSLSRHLRERIFFVPRLHEPLLPTGQTRGELSRLLDVFRASILPTPPVEAAPVYDLANLVLCIRTATELFQQNWNARLGLGSTQGEHWTRVKALSRRLAYQWDDRYDTLMPVADLIKFILERLGSFVENPRRWEPELPNEEGHRTAIDRVKREVHSRLLTTARSRVYLNRINEWGEAYSRRGIGSSRIRARNIRDIYEMAAAIPGETPATEANDFLDVIRELFREAASAAGAKVLS